MSCLFASGGQSIGASASASGLPMNAAAAAAKSLQSCSTVCDPIDNSPPGSPIPGILQARTLEWAAISFSNAWKRKVKVKLLSCFQLLATPWTAAYQAPPSMGFSRQVYWSGVPLPSPLPMNTQGWFPFGLTGLIPLQSRGLSRVFFSTTVWKSNSSVLSQLSHPYMTAEKTIALTIWTFVSKVLCLLFNTLFRFVIAFLLRSKRLYFMAVITICSGFGTQENKICHGFHFSPIFLPWSDGTRYHDLSFLNVEF